MHGCAWTANPARFGALTEAEHAIEGSVRFDLRFCGLGDAHARSQSTTGWTKSASQANVSWQPPYEGDSRPAHALASVGARAWACARAAQTRTRVLLARHHGSLWGGTTKSHSSRIAAASGATRKLIDSASSPKPCRHRTRRLGTSPARTGKAGSTGVLSWLGLRLGMRIPRHYSGTLCRSRVVGKRLSPRQSIEQLGRDLCEVGISARRSGYRWIPLAAPCPTAKPQLPPVTQPGWG